ncbi:MAG TPA: Ig-like domain-containing protein [Gemmataceae bacterium]|nr:Ig-like domain-containing protein [Gemmataceae bacterium]
MSIRRRARLAAQLLEDRAVPAAGLLDPTFSGDGYLIDSLGLSSPTFEDVVVQPDGKVLAVGHTSPVNLPRVPLVARFNADGTLDSTFNGTGYNQLFMGFGFGKFFAAALQGDKLIAVGEGNDGLVGEQTILARFKANGTLDPTFDQDGLLFLNASPNDEHAYAVAVRPDNKFVVAGSVQVQSGSSQYRAFVLRLLENGGLDTSFGGTGKVEVDVGDGSFAAATAVMSPSVVDGKIIIAGYSTTSSSGPNQSFVVARLTNFGALDPTFDGDGIVKTTPAAGHHAANDAALTLDGKIVLAGQSTVNDPTGSPRSATAVLRYNTDGSLDTTFGGTGYSITDLGTNGTTLTGMVVQSDGRIVAVGTAGVGQGQLSIVLRYNVDGTLDPTFGEGGPTLMPGVVITDVAPNTPDQFLAVRLQTDGRIVAVGHTPFVSPQNITLARYTNDPLTAVDDVYSTTSETPLSVPRLGYKANDVMPGNPEPVGELVTGPAHAAAFNFGANGSFTYTPAAGFVGEDTIAYRLTTSAGASNTATITITVTESNEAPAAGDDVYQLPETGPLVVAAPGVLANDTDPDGDPLSAIVVDPPAVGTLTLNPDGGFTYDFPAELVGPVKFTYKASDGTSESAPATVTLTRGPAVIVNGSVLTVRSTVGADAARLRRSGNLIRVELVTPEGVIVQTARPSGALRFTQVNVFLGDGDDHLEAAGLTVPVHADGGAGSDALRTGSGRDTVDGGSGNNVLITGSGNDAVTAGDGTNEIQSGLGNDTVTTGTGGSLIDAGGGNDVVTAAGGMNYLEGGAGNDVLVAGGGADVIDGGLGNDLIAGGAGADQLLGAAGNDILIDGSVALVNPATDSLTRVLADYRPSNRASLIDISTRITVTFDVAASDTLTGAGGTDWFWSDDPLDVLDLTGTEPKNAQV